MASLKYIIIVGILLASQHRCEEFKGKDNILSRKRRYVTFPAGSSFGVQSVLSKPFLDYSFPSDWNWNLEYTVSFKLPNDTIHNLEKMLRDEHGYLDAHRRERRHVYQQIEAILDLNGVNGKACLLRALCESKFFLATGESLLQDLLYVLLRMPAGPDNEPASSYDVAARHQDCEPWSRDCPVSLLGFLLATVSTLPRTHAPLPSLTL